VLAGDRIVAVGPSARIKAPSSARVIDGAGRFLLPGLWDLHVHVTAFGSAALPLFVANGVTGIRDVGGELSMIRAMAAAAKTGDAPRIVFSGPILDGPGTVSGPPKPLRETLRVALAGPDQAKAVVDSLATLGVDLIKVHSGLGRDAYHAVVDEARRRGLPVTGHIPDEVTAAEAIDAGQHAIDHQFGIPIANSGRVAELTARLVAAMKTYHDTSAGRIHPMGTHHVRLAIDDSALASYRAESARRFAAVVAAKGTWLVPTLAVLRVAARLEEDEIAEPATLRYVSKAAQSRMSREQRKAHSTAADIAAGRAKLERWLTAFRELHRAGARFATGTDVGFMGVIPGFSVHDELELLTRVGLSPAEALLAATRNAAAVAGRANRVGTIEVGKEADLVLLDANPLEDIRNTRRIQAVVLRGRALDRTALDDLLEAVRAGAESQ
jgi:imidazolonepropionase-like amidohydrolase